MILFRLFKCKALENYVLFCVIQLMSFHAFLMRSKAEIQPAPEEASIMVLSQVGASGHN
jgi:hypothetical protein